MLYLLICSFDFSMSGHRLIDSKHFYFYSASKYALTAINEGVRRELREMKSNVKMTVSERENLLLLWLVFSFHQNFISNMT